MPTNRTKRTRARSVIDDAKMEDLFYGPGACLLNGCGYLGPHGDGLWRDKSPDTQSEVLRAMEADWRTGHRIVMRAWSERGDHARWCADQHHGNPSQPWALTQFGDPTNAA